MNLPDDLQFGDILLYSTKDIVDELIEWKTSGPVAHVEMYAGQGKSWASRNGIGVNEYSYRSQGLVCVKRPLLAPLESHARSWFTAPIKGSSYGLGDIAENMGLHVASKDFDCSHFVAKVLAIGDSPQFDADYDPSLITPRDFLISSASTIIYGKTD